MEEKIHYKFIVQKCSQQMKITYIDKNDFTKKYKGLRRICPRAFKYLCFEVFKKNLFDKNDGKHILELPTDNLFKCVYGQVELVYSTSQGIIVIEDLKPNGILLRNYMGDIKIYKGIPYNNNQDLFKIKILCGGNK